MINAERLNPLRDEVTLFLETQRRRHGKNFRMNLVLVVLALVTSLLATIGGILEWPHKVIALVGVAGIAVVGLHAAFAIGDRAEFQRVVASDAENILTRLSDSALSEESFVRLRDQFTTLRSHAAEKLPRGGGVEAARKLPPPATGT